MFATNSAAEIQTSWVPRLHQNTGPTGGGRWTFISLKLWPGIVIKKQNTGTALVDTALAGI